MKLNLFAPLNTVSYGYVAAYIFKELLKAGVDLRYFPIGQIELEPQFQDLVPIIQKEWEFHKAACLKIWHQFDLAHYVGSPRIAMPIFELNKFNERETMHLENADFLFVPSNWAKQICDNNLSRDPNTTKVVPLGVDTSIFKPGIMLEGQTIFANFGKWEIRKGHDVLIQAFNAAFEKDDDVQLWMMTNNHMLTKQQDLDWRNLYLTSKLGDKIQFMDRQPTHEKVYDIMKYVHCGVFPTRAEGWNMEALELLACGKHLITTNYSGHTDYCTPDNSHLLEIKTTESAYDGLVFFGQGEWGNLTDCFDQLVHEMREMHKQNMISPLQDNIKGIETAQKYTWANTAQTIINHLQNL